MLYLRSLGTVAEQREIFKEFNPRESTWIVSDLKSKLDLNRSLLLDRDFIPGDGVLRASEFWKILLTRVRPDLQVVSREFAITIISDQLMKADQEWLRAPGTPQTVYATITQLMPILAHPNSDELMADWFEKNPAGATRWKHWHAVAAAAWRTFLSEGYIAPAWMTGVIVNELNLHEIWQKPLIVDLGAEITPVEADVLALLAASVDVRVLQPAPNWKEEYPRALRSYRVFDKLQGIKREVLHESGVKTKTARITYKKFTTMIAEVKDAVAQAREWLEQGEAPRNIAIVAPNIEVYWPSLHLYLCEEGIPINKNEVHRAHSFPDVAQWLACLRLRTGSASEADLELAVYSQSPESSMSYERFRILYSMIYGPEDLARDSEIARKFRVELKPDGEVHRDDFIAWAIRQLPEKFGIERIESIFKRVFSECPISLLLPLKTWLAYLEQMAARSESVIHEGDSAGIAVVNLGSAENLPASKMIILGLTETALRETRAGMLLSSDLSSLEFEYGFNLASEDQACAEFQARWISEDRDREIILSVPETDFSGAIQAPSWLWVRGAREFAVHDHLCVPRATRWDEIQNASLKWIGKSRNWNETHERLLEQEQRFDSGQGDLEPFGKSYITELSASGVEDYLNCPFIFAAKRLFSLSDSSELDIEVDPSRRGSLMHAVFELLTEEPFRIKWSKEELTKLIETARSNAKIELADERLWPSLRARYVDLAERFVSFESEYRSRFPETKTVGREFRIAGYLNPSSGELTTVGEEGNLKFTGRMDRIDTDASGRLAVYDYKSSAHSAKQFGSWIKNNRIQLLLYSAAIENGLTELEPRPVVAAIYYVSRPLARDNGFLVKDVEQGLYEIQGQKRNRITESEKLELFSQGRALLKQAAEGILNGDFAPSPRDPSLCPQCKWSALCRAPHLNL
jgi:ATP-dependent helicase/nuclease subunit B